MSHRCEDLQYSSCLVVSLQTIPMLVKLFETVLSHLSDPNGSVQQMARRRSTRPNVQVLSTPGDSATFLETMAGVTVLRLAKHKVL